MLEFHGNANGALSVLQCAEYRIAGGFLHQRQQKGGAKHRKGTGAAGGGCLFRGNRGGSGATESGCECHHHTSID